jgi:hypothetical protein
MQKTHATITNRKECSLLWMVISDLSERRGRPCVNNAEESLSRYTVVL